MVLQQTGSRFSRCLTAMLLAGGWLILPLLGSLPKTALGQDGFCDPVPPACPPGYRSYSPLPSIPQPDEGSPAPVYPPAQVYPPSPAQVPMSPPPVVPEADGQVVPPAAPPTRFSEVPSEPQVDFADAPPPDLSVGGLDLSTGLASSFGAGGATSLAFSDIGGYIDSPIVRSQIRFRFDASYDNPTPDRAEFLYPKCGCFVGAPTPFTDPNAPGPLLEETGIDFQELSLYAESLMFSDLISGFVEIPFRLINPEVNANRKGISDISFGVKAALLITQREYLTFQFRTFLPSGDGRDGLGTEHVTLEPGLLYLRRCSGGVTIQGEVRDYIPIGGTSDWAGNVLRYGFGISQAWYDDGEFSINPIIETAAWSVLSGDVFTENGVESAETTIVNVKVGTRFALAPPCRGQGQRSFYVGYGKALTDDRWYDDTLRAEYRLAF